MRLQKGGISSIMAAILLISIAIISVSAIGLIFSNTLRQAEKNSLSTTTTQLTSSPPGEWESAPQSRLSLLEGYFVSRFNPAIGLIAVGPADESGGGVVFSFPNGTAAPVVTPFQRYLPMENWATAAALAGLSFDPNITASVFASINTLSASVGWHASWNRESMMGFIIPYNKPNSNLCLVTPSGSYLTMPDGTQYQIDQAAPWDFPSQTWLAPDTNPNDGKGVNSTAIDEALFQAVNFYLRGDETDAMANLQDVAYLAVLNPDGSVGFGSAPYRGMFLGTFIEAAEVIGTPVLPPGITMDQIASTIWTLQAGQSDGGLPRQYSSFTNGVLGSDDETTNAALLAYSPGVIQYLQTVASSGLYNLASVPSANPTVGI